MDHFLVFALCISVIVAVHEAGHYLVARRLGIAIATCAIGFGPTLRKNQSTKTGTSYELKLFPIGGYCQWANETAIPVISGRALTQASSFTRLRISLAGPAANFSVALLLLIGAHLQVSTLTIQDLVPRGALAQAGVQAGDTIKEIDGKPVDFASLAVRTKSGQPMTLTFERNEQMQTVPVTPIDRHDGNGYRIGFYPMPSVQLTSIPRAIVLASQTMSMMTSVSIGSIITVIRKPNAFFSESSSIVGAESQQAQKRGLFAYLTFAAVVSFSFGVFNLLPIPGLDGGRSAFAIVEIIIRRRLNPQIEQLSSVAGFVFIVLLLIMSSETDVLNLLHIGKPATPNTIAPATQHKQSFPSAGQGRLHAARQANDGERN